MNYARGYFFTLWLCKWQLIPPARHIGPNLLELKARFQQPETNPKTRQNVAKRN